ncbi:MAG: glycosyltransferase [Lachnospiraceae bacterium]|nr:glycosyltransferase [Lachnospiraceae bacterium]
MDNVKVSVIVPAYNEEKYLERCLETVVNQTLEEIEIILVDDGSSDGTYDICEKYHKAYPQKVTVIHKSNEGMGLARNSGIAIAKGKYIGFVDGDDWVDVNMFKSMYETAENNDSDVVVCDVKKIFVSENRESVEISLPEQSGQIDIGKYIKDGLNPAYSWNKIYKKEIWNKYKFKKMVYEDLDIVLTILSNCKIVSYVQKPYNTYYKRANSITTSYTNIRLLDIMQAYKDAAYHANKKYKDETVFCVAKRILINMKTSGLIYYKADFIELIKELMPLFDENRYIKLDEKVSEIYSYRDEKVIPKKIYLMESAFSTQNLKGFIREYEVIKQIEDLNNSSIVKEIIDDIYKYGGILVNSNLNFNIPIGELRAEKCFIVYENDTLLMFGAQKNSKFAALLCESYNEDMPFDSNIRFAMEHYGMTESKSIDKYEIIIGR